MGIRRAQVGTSTGHERQPPTPVYEYKLQRGEGIGVTVWTYGAALVGVDVPDPQGGLRNVVVRLPSLRAYEQTGHYVGFTLGRYARCVAGGEFALDGVSHVLTRNEGKHHVHGGAFGFHRFVWDADAEQDGDELVLRLGLERPAGDEGYPGAISVETAYRVGERHLTFEHRARTTAPTIVDITNHALWNLSTGGTIDGHRLRIAGSRVLPIDTEGIPVGDPIEVAGTRFDYRSGRLIEGERLDNCFALDAGAGAAELADPDSGRVMRILTDQPGLQVYSGDVFPQRRAGICLQTGSWPDAPNRPDFPSARLDPGETYHHRTTHEFLAAELP